MTNLTVKRFPNKLRARNKNVLAEVLRKCVAEGISQFKSKNALAVAIEDIKYPYNWNNGKAPQYTILDNYEGVIAHLVLGGFLQPVLGNRSYIYNVDLKKASDFINQRQC